MRPSYCILFTYVTFFHLHFESIASTTLRDSRESVLIKCSLYQKYVSLLDKDTEMIYPVRTQGVSKTLQKPCVLKYCPISASRYGKCTNYFQRVNAIDNDGSISRKDLFEKVYRYACDDNRVLHLFNDQSNEVNVYIRTNDSHLLRGNETYKTEDFCIEYCTSGGDYGAVICEKNEHITPIRILDLMITNFGYASIFTALFIVINTFLYSIGTGLNSLYEKCVVFYMCSYYGVFQILAIMHFNQGKIRKPSSCLLIAALYFFNTLSKYAWANVICVKITLKFRSFGPRLNKAVILPGISKTKQLLFYCLYAWGIPLLIVLAIYIVEITSSADDTFIKSIIIRNKACLFQGMPSSAKFIIALVYFIILVNVSLFTYTVFQIFWRWRSSSILKNDHKNKERFHLFVKLMLVMGVPTIFHFLWWASLSDKMTLVLRYLLLIVEWSFFPSLLCNNKIQRNLINIFLSSCNKPVNASLNQSPMQLKTNAIQPSSLNTEEQFSPV